MKFRFLFFLIVCFHFCAVYADITPKNRQPQPSGYVYCPAGTLNYVLPDLNTTDSVTIVAFWMKETEVTNAEYGEFLKDLLDSGKVELHNFCYPDTALLKEELWIGNQVNYFTHPYFKNHPVTGITMAQANEYCRWLSFRYQAKYPEWDRSEFRIPLKEEWEYAARGGRRFNSYPWGYLVRNTLGCPLANFSDNEFLSDSNNDYNHLNPLLYYQWVYSEHMKKTGNLQTEIGKKRKKLQALYGMPVWVDSYFPNDWGLYNIAGNVAEMVIEQNMKPLYLGGSYRTEARHMNLNWMLHHPFPAPQAQVDVGFRPVMGYIPRQSGK